MGELRNIIEDNKFRNEDLPAFEAKLFFEGAQRRICLERFDVLLFLSTVISTIGIVGDSVATVIGDMKRAGSSFLIALVAIPLVMSNVRIYQQKLIKRETIQLAE